MKKLKNMNTEEVKQLCDKVLEQTPIQDSFDLQGLQLIEYRTLIADQVQRNDIDGVMNTIADIYNHGFVAGKKQKESIIKTATDKQLKNEYHRELVELAYNLPCGVTATYFYPFMCFYLEKEGYISFLPKKVRNKVERWLQDYRERKEQEKEESQEQLTDEERQHRKEVTDLYMKITRLLMDCDNIRVLNFIHTFTVNVLNDDTESEEKQ